MNLNESSSGQLFLVPTPIGNLEDMTCRAVDTLASADLIASEDTRHTQKLLNHFKITTPQISYHEHNENQRADELISQLKAGKNIAQVSDAGTPCISDPGSRLVKRAIAEDITVTPLPGANAALTALIASGLSSESFTFIGFLPRSKNDRRESLEQWVNRPETLIFYESPHRLKKTLSDIGAIFGSKRPASLCRELTKKFEEFIRGTIDELIDWTESNEVRGEFVLIVGGNPDPAPQIQYDPEESVINHVNRLITTQKIKPKAAMKQVAKIRHLKTSDIYDEYHQIK